MFPVYLNDTLLFVLIMRSLCWLDVDGSPVNLISGISPLVTIQTPR